MGSHPTIKLTVNGQQVQGIWIAGKLCLVDKAGHVVRRID